MKRFTLYRLLFFFTLCFSGSAILAQNQEAMSLYDQGSVLFYAKKYNEAITPLQQSIAANGEIYVSHRLLAETYFEIKNYKKAAEEYEQSIGLAVNAKDKKSVYYQLAVCYAKINTPQALSNALAAVDKLLEMDPKYPKAEDQKKYIVSAMKKGNLTPATAPKPTPILAAKAPAPAPAQPVTHAENKTVVADKAPTPPDNSKAKAAEAEEELKRKLEESNQAIEVMTERQAKDKAIYENEQHLLAEQKLINEQQSNALQREVDKNELQASQRNLLLLIAGIVLILALALLARYINSRKHNNVLKEKNKAIEEEKKRAEDLLLNILPLSVANELKKEGKAQARYFHEASVMFTDFEGFTRISSQATPTKMVSDLDFCFAAFDDIITKHGLEKIKTIGDAYMCASGLPEEHPDHAIRMVKAAKEIHQFLAGWNRDRIEKGDPPLRARIGIHSGPVVAGVVGKKKFAYDIWGETVNLAARMESSGEPDKINITKDTWVLVKDLVNCEYRGKKQVKGVGDTDMYFVES